MINLAHLALIQIVMDAIRQRATIAFQNTSFKMELVQNAPQFVMNAKDQLKTTASIAILDTTFLIQVEDASNATKLAQYVMVQMIITAQNALKDTLWLKIKKFCQKLKEKDAQSVNSDASNAIA